MRTKLLLFFICIFLISCKKENAINSTVPTVNNDNIGDNIVFGNTSNLLLLSYTNPYIHGYNIDFDRDGYDDILIVSGIYGSPAQGYHSYTMIECLNTDCKISGTIVEDTTFLYTIIGKDISGRGTIDYYTSCQRIIPLPFVNSLISIDSSIRISSGFRKMPRNKAEVLNKNEVFKTDTSYLLRQSYYYTNLYDNTWITQHNDYSCHVLPLGVEKYIGIKKKVSGIEKLGWIKLIVNSGNYTEPTILEVAIQK